MQVIIYAQRTHYGAIYFSKYNHTGAGDMIQWLKVCVQTRGPQLEAPALT